jgi:hypothetical protein
MNEAKKYKELEKSNDPELDQIHLLLEKAEGIHKDLGNFITALDKLYLEKKTAGQPPAHDFLKGDNSFRG